MKKRINIIMILFLTAIVCSCESYLDKHQEFIKDGGETIYLQKVDSIASYAGINRVQLKLWYTNAHNLTNTTIYYNNRADSIVLSLEGMKPGKDVKIQVLDLPEGNYDLEIVNSNKYGQSSLATDYFVSTYGDNYLAQLENRGLKSSAYTEPGIFTVAWFPAPDNYQFLELKYTDGSSGEKIVRVGGENETIIEGVADVFTYRTAYTPENQVIDTFYTEWSKDMTIDYPNYFVVSEEAWDEREHDGLPRLDGSTWTVLSVTSQEPTASGGGLALNMLDNKTGTFWHTQWDPWPPPLLPHIIIFDMLENRLITSLEVFKRFSELQDMSFEISADNTNWTSIGELSFPNSTDPPSKVLVYNKEISGQYLKLTVLRSYGGSGEASIRNIYFTGKK